MNISSTDNVRNIVWSIHVHKGEWIESEMRLQAVRTAWRIVKDWVEAQCALIESQMVTTEQVFLPYAVMKDGHTLSEQVLTGQLLLN